MARDVRWEPTGEHRPPNAGEWIKERGGYIQAMFDFSATSHDIYRMVVFEVPDKPKEEPARA